MNRRDAETQRMHENEVSEKIIGCAIEVHRALGPGLLEEVYLQCLCRELALSGLQVRKHVPLPVDYKGVHVECGYRLDIIVEEAVVVELKAVERILAVHEAQILTYLHLTGCRVGLILNFHQKLLVDGIKRFVNNLPEPDSELSQPSSAPPRLRGSNANKVVGIIPARLAATRLPDKPLAMIAGKTMIQRVWERARQAACLSDLLVATQDQQIYEAVEAFGGRAVMTSDKHRSGTDRLAEAAADLEADIIVNIQGDEPLIDPATIEQAVQPLLDDPTLPMSSLMCPCPAEERDNPATVKVVTDAAGNALYFSRSRIPFPRSPEGGAEVMQHIGLYAYRRDFLLTFSRLAPTPLEATESLEQLRALEHGYRIRLVRVERAPLSVDTPEDLERVTAIIARE